MNYKYQKRQIFGKRLKVPKNILSRVYNCTLSFSEFVEYELDDKIPITCLNESDRQIVEKFGVEKAKTLDWELLSKQEYYNNSNFRELLMGVDASVEDLNTNLYELAKNQIKPSDYSLRMKEVYQDRLFEISQDNDDNLNYEKRRFNDGEISLENLVHNWDLYKDKDLSYCLQNDRHNELNITNNQLKKFMNRFENISRLILDNTNIYQFIHEINDTKSESKKQKYIKQITDNILEKSIRKDIELSNNEYKDLFKYSSMQDYLKSANRYREYDIDKIFEELKTLPQAYIFNIPIPFAALNNSDVLSFIGTYGLKNVVDFDNECGHFFTKNNCEMLKLMHDMYLRYGENEHDPNKTIYTRNPYDENGNYIDRPYTKDEFYETMKRMIIYGPSDWNYADKAPDYRDMTGEFRIRNEQLFISEQAPEELQKLFYTKNITPQLLVEHPEYIPYLNGKDLGSCFILRQIKVDDSKDYYGYENLYNFIEEKSDFNTTMGVIVKYALELEIIFNTSYLLFNESLSEDFRFSKDSSIDDILKQIHDISNGTKFKCVVEFSKIQDEKLRKVFKEYVREFGNNIDIEKIEYVSEVLSRISLSNSSEISTFRKELANQILKSTNPIESLNKIEDIFIRNNLPTVGKMYSCFEILHPDFQGFNFDSSIVSPVLKKSSIMGKKIIVFTDLIKSSFGSNNKSVNAYLKNIEVGSKLYESIKSGQIEYKSLDKKQMNELIIFSKYLTTLYNNTMKGKKEKETFTTTGDVLTDILELSKKLSPDRTLDYSLADRVIRMFCGFAGIDTLEQAKSYIDQKIKTADARNRNASSSEMILEQGDFIKGIGDVTYLRNILQNGSVSKEYLGSSAGSDATPLDTDVSMITESDGTIKDKFSKTDANGYGPIWFVLKNDDRFITTRNANEALPVKNNMSKMEVFYTGVLGLGHYGIRTGFASSEINYIVMDSYDSRVGLEIAMNGFYIPIANKEGKIVFTPNDYDDLRSKMAGLSYYGENNYVFSDNLVNEDTSFIAAQIEKSNTETNRKRNLINVIIKESLEETGLAFKDRIDGDLSEGVVEVIDTGSTGRGTNKPGDGDFDFMMRLDKSMLTDSSKMEHLKKNLLKKLGKENSSELTNTGDFRLKQVKIDDKTSVDIDISFTGKTDKISYSTDMCLQERLSNIYNQNPQKYDYVVANILLAKQVLKENDVYKPNRGENPQGGLGGVGIENWILQNGGSFIDAATSFLDASKEKNFEEFKNIYYIWDFGENHMTEARGHYLHDNFVSNNMSQSGYNKMVQVLKEYMKNHDYSQVDVTSETDSIKR